MQKCLIREDFELITGFRWKSFLVSLEEIKASFRAKPLLTKAFDCRLSGELEITCLGPFWCFEIGISECHFCVKIIRLYIQSIPVN